MNSENTKYICVVIKLGDTGGMPSLHNYYTLNVLIIHPSYTAILYYVKINNILKFVVLITRIVV